MCSIFSSEQGISTYLLTLGNKSSARFRIVTSEIDNKFRVHVLTDKILSSSGNHKIGRT